MRQVDLIPDRDGDLVYENNIRLQQWVLDLLLELGILDGGGP